MSTITVLLYLLSVYFMLTRIFGHSATELTILIGVFTILGSLIIHNSHYTLKINRELGELKVETKACLAEIKKDIGEMKMELRDFHTMNTDIATIKKKIKI